MADTTPSTTAPRPRTKPSKPSMLRRSIAILPKVLRLSVFIAVIYVVGSLFVVRAANAEVEEIMLGFGAEMMQFPGATDGDEVRSLVVNGQAILFRTQVTELPMAEVLAHYEAACMQRDGRFAEQIAELQLDPRVGAGDGEARDFDGTMMLDLEDHGFVACLDMGEDEVGAEGVLDRVTNFLETGDLSRVGHMRYVYVQPQPDTEGSNTEGSHIVSVWTDGELNLFEMFPSDGDSPGRNVSDVPRPPQSQRMLDAHEADEPYGISVFASQEADLDVLQAFYQEALPDQGWTLLQERGSDLGQPRHVVTAEKDDRIISVVLAQDEMDSSLITILTSD